MTAETFDQLRAEVLAAEAVRDIGRVSEVSRSTITVSNLLSVASMGDRIRWIGPNWNSIDGEIVRITADGVVVLMEGSAQGISIGNRVQHLGASDIAPHQSWLGRIIDPSGKPLDGRPLMRGLVARPFQSAPPPATQRKRLGNRVETGLAVFNTLLPIVVGQRIGLFAGSGVGKTRLLGQLAMGVEADVVVVALVGERGRELREFVENVLGPESMKRTIIVVATSDQPPISRRQAMWSAMVVAEYFRDAGLHVLLLADSVTRFAEAHREIALASGETGSLRGYPPSVAHMIMSLAERAGPGCDGSGDITAIFSVLVSGSDMDEPISDILRGTLDGHVVLSREIAERGRFPALDVLKSVSRSLPDAANGAQNASIARARRLLGVYDRAALMIQSGLYASGSDPEIDHAIRVWPAMDEFISIQNERTVEDSFAKLANCLAPQEPKKKGN